MAHTLAPHVSCQHRCALFRGAPPSYSDPVTSQGPLPAHCSFVRWWSPQGQVKSSSPLLSPPSGVTAGMHSCDNVLVSAQDHCVPEETRAPGTNSVRQYYKKKRKQKRKERHQTVLQQCRKQRLRHASGIKAEWSQQLLLPDRYMLTIVHTVGRQKKMFSWIY